MDDLRKDIEAFLEASGMSPTRLGKDALNDPGFVAGIRAGRQCLPRTAERVRAWMRAHGQDKGVAA